MKATEIKIGMQFSFKPTGNTYKVVRHSEISVWYELGWNGCIKRVSVNTFLGMMTTGRSHIEK
jgi:hypothetical protein